MAPRLSLLMAFVLIGAVLTVPVFRDRTAGATPQADPQEDAATSQDDQDASIALRGPDVFSTALTPEHLLLPTGEMVPVLNDALGAPPLKWADNRPWSPIVGTETDPEGKDWYVHEDGTKTITRIVYDAGNPVASTDVAYPVGDMPDGELSGKDDGRIRD